MADLVPPNVIEQHVGAVRHPTLHLGRDVSDEETVYVLHSAACVAEHEDLRECWYSRALDRGINLYAWDGYHDEPVVLSILAGRLIPAWRVSADDYTGPPPTDGPPS